MKQAKPIIHGRDHAPGGADPIPNLVAAGAHFPWAVVSSNSSDPVNSTIPSGTNRLAFFGASRSDDFAEAFIDPVLTCSDADAPLQLTKVGLYLVGGEILWNNDWGDMNFQIVYDLVGSGSAVAAPLGGFGFWEMGGTNVFSSLQAAKTTIGGVDTSRRHMDVVQVFEASATDPAAVQMNVFSEDVSTQAAKHALGAVFLGPA